MEKIWIIHNSLSPEDIAKDEPYGLIIAVRIVAFSSDREIRNFTINLDKVITKPISKVAYFSTHALGWKKLFIKGMKKTLGKIGCVEEVCPEYLEVKMQKAEGPAIEGADVKIGEFISTLKEFMK